MYLYLFLKFFRCNYLKKLTFVGILILGSSSSKSEPVNWFECAKEIKYQLNTGNYEKTMKSVAYCREKYKPDDSLEYLIFLNNSGIAYAEFGQHDEAIEIKKEVITRTLRNYSSKHPEVVDAQLGLAIAYLYAEKPKEALPHLMSAYETAQQPIFLKPLLALRVERTLATTYDMLGDLDRAVNLAKKALISAEENRIDSLELSFFQTELALMLRKVSNFPAAIPLLLAAYEVRKANAPSGNFGVANSAFNLGLAYMDICAIDDAKKMLGESFDWRIKNLGNLHPATIRAKNLMNALDKSNCK